MGRVVQPIRPRHITRTLLVLLLQLLLLMPGAPAAPLFAQQPEPVPAAAGQAAVSARLAAELAAADGPVDFLVFLRDQLDPGRVVAASAAAHGTTQERAAVLYAALTGHARSTQAALRGWLDAQGVEYRPFYVANMLLVTGDAAVAEALVARPEVARLAANPPVRGLQAFAVARPPAQAVQALPWGLEFTRAPELWAQGIDGSGIVIASQDTGVWWDHPALKAQYRGWDAGSATADHVYQWFDAFGVDAVRQMSCPGAAATDAQIPCDDYRHGTHTVGTLVGDATSDGGPILGMAPGARWIGCRNMSSGVGTPASYAACFEFFLAPYPQDGDPMQDGRPDLAPHIINNSWSCLPSEGCDEPEILRAVVESARAAGQFVAASAGNTGFMGCGSINNPIAIYDAVFSVGSLGSGGEIAFSSSRGPVTADGSRRLKPDISAPGEGVYSAVLEDAFGGRYAYMSGTSMASPHVAGAVALLWSAVPALIGDIDATEAILRVSATPAASEECAGPVAPGFPNPTYGAGRLDAAAALALAQEPPSLRATVISLDGVSTAGTVVTVEDLANGLVYTQTAGAGGAAVFPAIYTRDWSGERVVTMVRDERSEPVLIVNAPYRRLFPWMTGSGD